MNRKLVVLVVGMLVASGVFIGLMGTGAVDRESDITLSPHPENGEYVVYNESGNVTIEFDGSNNDNLTGNGINTETYYEIDNVFNVTNENDGTIEFYVNDSSADVTFYKADDPTHTLENESNRTSLGPSETAVVGIAIDTRGDSDAADLSNMTIVAEIVEEETDEDEEDDTVVQSGGGSGDQEDDETETVEKPASITASIQGEDVTVPVQEGEALSGVGFDSQTSMDTVVSVTEVTDPAVPDPEGTEFVAGASISLNQDAGESVERIRMQIRRSRLDDLETTSDNLLVHHLNEETGEWETLETQVVREDGEKVVLEAPSAGFSTYAVFAQEQVETTTTEPTTAEPTTEAPPTEEPTTTESPMTESPTTEPPSTTSTEDEGPSTALIGAIIVVILALIAGLYFAYGRE